MRATWLPDILPTATIHPGALTRGSIVFEPAGIVWHHDASSRGYNPARYADFLARGRSDLPGPLYNIWIDRTARIWIIGTGRANHAGAGRWRGLAGNTSVMGLCLANDGRGERYPDAQIQTAVAVSAAIAGHLGFDASMVCGHKEWTTRKPDPAGIRMDVIRGQIDELLTGGEDMITQGETGHYVRWYQQALNGWRASVGLELIDANGVYGPATTQAVKDYQAAAQIPVTGSIDVRTVGIIGKYHPDMHTPPPVRI